MADKHIDEGKGRLKQAAGSLTDDQQPEERGQGGPGQGHESRTRSTRSLDALTGQRDKK